MILSAPNILSIVKVLIAKHLDASDTLNYEILLKEKIKRLYTAFTSDYQLHTDCQQAPIHCNSCITIFDPNILGIDTTYKHLSLHVKSIYERLLKNVYFNIITFLNIL